MIEGKRISELDVITNLHTGCCFPVLSTGSTKRITFGSLLSEIENKLPDSGIEQVKEDVAGLKNRADEMGASIETMNADVENVKETVADVDEMVAGQNATIRNCVSTVEDLERTVEQTHFDDVLELEEQVRANTANIERNTENIETKLDKTTSEENAGKAVVVDEEGNLVFGAAGVQVSEEEGNAIEEKEDGIYVAPLPEGLSGLPIGASILWASENIPAGFLKYDGTIYNKSDYPVLFTRIPDEWKIDENTFKLPDVKDRVAQGADGNLGELIEAGLPNITGIVSGIGGAQVPVGAFYSDSNGNVPDGSWSSRRIVKFDASKGETKTDGTLKTADEHHVYGASDTVQMAAIALYYIIKATDYTTVQEDVIDDTKYTTGNVLSAAKVKEEIESVDNKNNYSTEETVIGTWIDGKPIYRKVIDITPKSFNSWEYIDETDNLNIDKVIKSVLFGTEGSTFTDVMENAVVRRYENRKFAFITIGYTFQANTLLIEYTKTTD